MTRKMWIADGILLLTAMIWGFAFAVVKNTLDSVPPLLLVTVRYVIAACITMVVFRRHLTGLSAGDVKRGALTGFMLAMAYSIQTQGMLYTTAGKNAFLTTLYVLLVPLGSFLLFRTPLRKRIFLAGILMLLGIGLISLGSTDGGLNRGDVLTLICSIFYAGHILCIEHFQKKTDVRALIVLQFAFCALTAFVLHCIFEQGAALRLSRDSIIGILYLSVFSSTLGMSLQNIGQSMARSDHAVILLSLESVFGALGGCLLLGEQVTPTMGAGFAVVFVSLVLNELGG